MKVVLEISFLTFSNANIWFAKKKYIHKSYIIAKALPTIQKVKLINNREFTATVIDENSKIFVIYVATPKVL